MEIFVVEVLDPALGTLIYYEPFVSEKDAQLAMDSAVAALKEAGGADVTWITEGKAHWPVGASISFAPHENISPIEYRICRRELVDSTEV